MYTTSVDHDDLCSNAQGRYYECEYSTTSDLLLTAGVIGVSSTGWAIDVLQCQAI